MEPILNRQFVFGSIFMFANKLQVTVDRMDANISMKQWFFLSMLAQFNDAPTITELAELTGNSRQNVKKIANILNKKGMIELLKDKEDSRITRIIRTESCISYYREREVLEEKYLNELFLGFSEDEIRLFKQAMEMLGKNIFRLYDLSDQELQNLFNLKMSDSQGEKDEQ